jgi:hypothetical protein
VPIPATVEEAVEMPMEPLYEKLPLHVKDAKMLHRDFHHGFLVDHTGAAAAVAAAAAVEVLVDTPHDEEVEVPLGNVVARNRNLEEEEEHYTAEAGGCYCT